MIPQLFCSSGPQRLANTRLSFYFFPPFKSFLLLLVCYPFETLSLVFYS